MRNRRNKLYTISYNAEPSSYSNNNLTFMQRMFDSLGALSNK
jgi:hypothetical protein